MEFSFPPSFKGKYEAQFEIPVGEEYKPKTLVGEGKNTS